FGRVEKASGKRTLFQQVSSPLWLVPSRHIEICGIITPPKKKYKIKFFTNTTVCIINLYSEKTPPTVVIKQDTTG
ncbi:MAG: hypothetical protein AAGD88_06055, partial [Bacteroidota bacterium]